MTTRTQSTTTAQASATATKAKTRPRTEGVLIGMAAQKLVEIGDEEAAELSESPATIRARHDGRRETALEKLTPEQRESAKMLAAQMRPGKTTIAVAPKQEAAAE